MSSLPTLGVERVGASLIPIGIGAVLLDTALRGFGLGPLLAAGVSVACAVAGIAWLARRLPANLDGVLRRRPTMAILWFLLGILSIGATAHLGAFMADEAKAENSIYPFDDFFVHHSCLSAHYQSATLQRAGVANVYERTNFEGPQGEPKFLNSFVIDVFLYPPPMLLLSRLALWLSEDFAAWRAVWFGIEGGIVAVALLAVAGWIGGPQGERAALLAPLVWLSFPTLLTLQIGNLHLVAFAAAILAMLAFERGHHAFGGAVLSALVLFKIFPGILVLLLLFQRRWRSVAWCATWGRCCSSLLSWCWARPRFMPCSPTSCRDSPVEPRSSRSSSIPTRLRRINRSSAPSRSSRSWVCPACPCAPLRQFRGSTRSC